MELKELAPWIAIAITLALSILVPLFTQIANNRHQRKMMEDQVKREESQKKIKAYEDFILKVGAAITYASKENLDIAGACLYQIYLYCPKEWFNDLDRLADVVRNHDWETANTIMQKLIRLMSDDINKISNNEK